MTEVGSDGVCAAAVTKLGDKVKDCVSGAFWPVECKVV